MDGKRHNVFAPAVSSRDVSPHLILTIYHTDESEGKPVLGGPKTMLGDFTHMCALSRQVVSNSFETSWTAACQSPLSTEFSRQQYWSGLPFPFPGDFPDPGIKPTSPVSPTVADRLFITEPPGKPFHIPASEFKPYNIPMR